MWNQGSFLDGIGFRLLENHLSVQHCSMIRIVIGYYEPKKGLHSSLNLPAGVYTGVAVNWLMVVSKNIIECLKGI